MGCPDFAEMWSAANPPIPVHDREAARERLRRVSDQHIMIDWGEGPKRFNTGMVDARDYTRRDGYLVVPQGFDKWGYRINPPARDTET
jgi:hypothetical protein